MYKIASRIEMVNKKAYIIPFGDIHYGSPNCRLDKFKDLIKWGKNKKNVFWIGMGDYIDAIVPHDPRFQSDRKFEKIDKSVDKMIGVLKPISERILTLITGNHEDKISRAGYFNPTKRMCEELDVPYGGYSTFIKVRAFIRGKRLHNRPLVIYAMHGYSSSRLTGSAVNGVERLAQWYDADIFLVAHNHKLWSTRQVRIDYGGYQKKIFANTGTFLETATIGSNEYAERKGYPPLKLGVIKILIKQKGHGLWDLHTSE